jgi:hypothetical protein
VCRSLARGLAGGTADLPALLSHLADPPIDVVGALRLDGFLPKTERRALAASLNTLLASPTFASWRTGATLDVEQWLSPTRRGQTRGVIMSVAHLDDEERSLVGLATRTSLARGCARSSWSTRCTASCRRIRRIHRRSVRSWR